MLASESPDIPTNTRRHELLLHYLVNCSLKKAFKKGSTYAFALRSSLCHPPPRPQLSVMFQHRLDMGEAKVNARKKTRVQAM